MGVMKYDTDKFLKEIEAVCLKHQLVLIADGYGSEVRIDKYSEEDIAEIRKATPLYAEAA